MGAGLLHFIVPYWIMYWWRRRESNPRPENKTQRAYMLSQCFKSRTGEHPLTGFLSSQPIKVRRPV